MIDSLTLTSEMLMYLPECDKNHANTIDGTLKCPRLVAQIRIEKKQFSPGNFLAAHLNSIIVMKKFLGFKLVNMPAKCLTVYTQ